MRLADLADLAPQPGHVSGGEHAQRKDDAREIPIQQGLVVDFLAADRFDGEDVGAGFSAQFQGPLEPLPRFSGARLRGLLLVANISGCDAQRARQTMLFVTCCEIPLEDSGNLRASTIPGTPSETARRKICAAISS
jgi:hypothetical protein